MTNSPKLLKGGIVLLDPETAMVLRIIPFQYNSDSISRTLQVQGLEGEKGLLFQSQEIMPGARPEGGLSLWERGIVPDQSASSNEENKLGRVDWAEGVYA